MRLKGEITMSEKTTTNDMRLWRVFYTRARAEKKCESLLVEREIEVFLPKRAVRRQWKDRKKKVIEPLFNNYIFAHVDEHERLVTLQTPGIVSCVSFGNQLAIVDEEQIDQLKIASQAPERLALLDFPLPDIGEEVTITELPLRGLRGRVVEHRGQLHVVVQVTAIRQSVRVNVPAEWLLRHRSAA